MLDAYLRFEDPSSKIPPQAQIENAYLCLYYSSEGGTEASEISAYKALRSWDEMTSSWNNASTGQPWGLSGARQDGVDREAPPIDTIRVVDASVGLRYFCWDLVTAVEQWLSSSSPNYGVIMQAVTDLTPYRVFTERNTQQAPFIEVLYSIETPRQDIDRDGIVGLLDMGILTDQWLSVGTGLESDIFPYEQPDEKVNLADFAAVVQKWLTTEPWYGY